MLMSVELLGVVAQPLYGMQSVTADVKIHWVGGIIDAQTLIKGVFKLGWVAEGSGLSLPLVNGGLLSGGLR